MNHDPRAVTGSVGPHRMNRRVPATMAWVLALVLAACEPIGGSADGRPARTTATLTAVDHAAPLSRALPAEAVAYLRIPSFADWLLAPRRDGLNELKVSDAHRKLADALLAGIEENLLALFDAPVVGLAGTLLADLRSPLEVAFFSTGGGVPIPGVLVRTELAGYDRELVVELLEAVTGQTGLALAGPLDEDGHAIVNAGVPVFVHFDEGTGALHLLSGSNANRTMLDAYRSGQYEASSRLGDFERTIDDTGRHLAVWVDLQRWWPMLAASQAPDQLAKLEALGVDQAESLWAGFASREGRAAAIVHLAMPVVGLRAALPPVRAPGALEVAADMRWAARVALPTREDVTRLVASVETLQPGTQEAFDAFLAQAEAYLEFDAMSFLDAYGPDLLVVSDAAGLYTAYGLADEAAAGAIGEGFVARDWVALTERSMKGLALTEIWVSGTALFDDEVVGGLPAPFPTLLPRLGGRSFVVDEGAYRVVASVPQVLADRAARPRRSLGAWLTEHGVSWDRSLLAVLRETEHAPRDIYYGYLQLLSWFASVTDVEIDLTQFPTAPDLGLPPAGRLGLQLDTAEAWLRASFVYETTPIEALLNVDLLTWYLVGVGAAVAIPAYQDFQRRVEGGPDSCDYAFDGECDEPDLCAEGTDMTDCRAMESPDSCIHAFDGECDEPGLCAIGTDSTDCRGGAPADTCESAKDGVCDEPQACAEGTDTTDCTEPPEPDSCMFANDGECDEPVNCPVGTDTTDCEANPPAPDSCPWAGDGECDEPDTCRPGTDTTDCAPAGDSI